MRAALRLALTRPEEICQFDFWEPNTDVWVGQGQARRGWVLVASVASSAGRVQATWDAEWTDLRLDYTHDGQLAGVLVEPPGGTPLELLLAADEVAAEFCAKTPWRLTPDGSLRQIDFLAAERAAGAPAGALR